MERNHYAHGIVWRCVCALRASLVWKERANQILNRVRFRFRCSTRARISLTAHWLARRIDSSPAEREVAVEINTRLVENRWRISAARAIRRVQIFALIVTLLRNSMSIRVHDRHYNNLVFVQKPRNVRINSVVAQKIINESQCEFGGRQLARVYGGHQKKCGLHALRLFVGQSNSEKIAASRAAHVNLLPAISVSVNFCEIRIARGFIINKGSHLSDRAIAAAECFRSLLRSQSALLVVNRHLPTL